MADRCILALEDGAVFEGVSIGARGTSFGEVVFNTSMTGYQEILTDPSYSGQIVLLTYPLIGNYGVNQQDSESRRIQASGLIVRKHCDRPSHWLETGTVDAFMKSGGVPGISEVDTRAITRRLRTKGVMMGMITTEHTPADALDHLSHLPRYGDIDFVQTVTTGEPYLWTGRPSPVTRQESDGADGQAPLIVVIDLGVKYNILRILWQKGCRVEVAPASIAAEDVLALRPNGVVLSPGPGDPAMLEYVASNTRGILGRVPVMGICMGHQVLAHALGAKTYKLKFGHRGGNHPVQDHDSGKVHITAQNHGYAVDPDTLPAVVRVTHVNLNDNTVEGMRHSELPALSIQYHSEASPGPNDNAYMFDRFLDLVTKGL